MSEEKNISPKRFILYIGVGSVIFVLVLFGLGALITQLLWPTQKNLSHPVMTASPQQ